MNRTISSLVALAAIVALVIVLLTRCDASPFKAAPFTPTRVRSLDGPGEGDRFMWSSGDHGLTVVVSATPTPTEPTQPPAPVSLSSDVTFGKGRAELVDGAAVDAQLLPIVAALQAQPDLVVVIDGFASADGEFAANHELSLRRGETIRDRLLAAHVDPSRILVRAHGEADLPVPAEPESPLNRVVTVTLGTTGGAS